MIADMTPEERIAYSHGRIKRDMQDFQSQINKMHKDIARERNLWFVLVAMSTVLIGIMFYITKPDAVEDYILVATVVVAFTVIRFVSYNAMKRQLAMLEGMKYLYSRLANDETVKFVSESMKVDSDAEHIKKMTIDGEGTDKVLREQIILAARIVDAIVVEVEKHKAERGENE